MGAQLALAGRWTASLASDSSGPVIEVMKCTLRSSMTFSRNVPITSVDSSALVIRFPTAVGQVPSSVSRP